MFMKPDVGAKANQKFFGIELKKLEDIQPTTDIDWLPCHATRTDCPWMTRENSINGDILQRDLSEPRARQAELNVCRSRQNRERWMESDPKRVVREWNREIETEISRRSARREDGPWKVVVWVALAMVWFGVLFAAIGVFERLQR
jgi:hypothetical protein